MRIQPDGRRAPRLAALVVIVALVLTLVPTSGPGAAEAPAPAPLGPDELELVAEERLSDRMVDLTFRTPALATDEKVRVLLPAGFDPASAQRYPVLYLLHGGAGGYADWTRPGLGRADQLTEGLPLIVVMPEASAGGWYTDWFHNGAGGPPRWESFHIDQLVGWIDGHYPTVARREGRALAGLSMGGFGTMSYAARHPDHFVAAASFSGAVDTNAPPLAGAHVIDLLALQDGGVPGSLWGMRETEEVRWRGDNPWDLAANLRGLLLVLRTGDGQAGGDFGGGGPTDPVGAALEIGVHEQTTSLHHRLDALGIAHVYDDYGPGTHSWPYWNRGLAQTLPLFMATFADPPPAPSPFSFTAIERGYDIYGWDVALDRPVLELSTLADADRHGFSLSGTGSATVTTAALYPPGRPLQVVVRGPAGEETDRLRADRHGRLQVEVPLGPPNLDQQRFLPDGSSPLTRVETATVEVAPARGGGPPPGRPPVPRPIPGR